MAREIRGSLKRELKPDGTIVTTADRAVETLFRRELTQLVPGATIWGEEEGYAEPGENGLWVVDPIDGTSNFAYGGPLWGVTAALVQGSEIVVGVICLPDLDEMYVAERGAGATRDGAALDPIPPGAIRPEELVGYCEWVPRRLPGVEIPGKMRCLGSFVIEGAFVATQRLRGLMGVRERLYDVAASVLLGQELGAEIRNVDGTPIDIEKLSRHGRFEKPWMIFPADNGFVA